MKTTPRTAGSYDRRAETTRIEANWAENSRWQNVSRTYSAEDVVRLRGSIRRDNTIAQLGAEKLWELLANSETCLNAAGAMTGSDAVQQIANGTRAIYLPASQATAEHTPLETIRPDQSLYAIDSIPSLVRRINNAFERADQIQWKHDKTPSDADYVDYFAPILADAETHSGGALNAYELTKNMIRAGAAGVHFDDQFASIKQRNQIGNILMPTSEVVQKLSAARLAADVEEVATLIVARTTAFTTHLLSSNCDDYDHAFIDGKRTEEGFYSVRAGIEQAIARGLAYAPYADLLVLETAELDLAAARQFAEAIRREHPEQLLAYSCAAACTLDVAEIEKLQRELATLGYTFQCSAHAEQQCDWNAARAEMAA